MNNEPIPVPVPYTFPNWFPLAGLALLVYLALKK